MRGSSFITWGEMLLGTFGTWQMGISCDRRKFFEYILNGKDMLNRFCRGNCFNL